MEGREGERLDVGFPQGDLRTWAGMLLLVTLSGVIWITWFLWLAGQSQNLPFAIVGSGLLCMAQVIATELGIGLARALYGPVLAATNLGLATGIFFAGVWPVRTKILRRQKEWLAQIRAARPSRFVWALLLLVAVAAARSAVQAFFLPPREWDALVYHFPIMAYIYQAHAVEPIISPGVRTTTYPFGGELLALWNLIFVGVDKLVDLAALPGILTGALAVYGIARHWGATRNGAAAGAAVFAFAPTMVIQQVSAHGDALMASVFAMGVYCILASVPDRTAEVQEYVLAVLAGTAIGLIAAIKYAGLFYAAGLAILFMVKLAVRRSHLGSLASQRGQAGIVFPILVAAILALALGGYPYLRNIVLFRNPLAPFNVRLAGHTLFTGERGTAELITTNTPPNLLKAPLPERLVMIWLEPYASIYDESVSGSGPLWFFLGLPSLLVWAIHNIVRRRWEQTLITLLVLLSLAATPAFWVPRYGIPIVLLGAPALAWIFGRLKQGVQRVLCAEVLLGACFVILLTMDLGRVDPRVLRDYMAWRTDFTRSSAEFAWEGRGALPYVENETHISPPGVTYSDLVQFVYPL